MSRRERWYALTVAFAISLVLAVPYVVAFAMTPPERAFMGHIWNPDEPNVYYSWMRQAADGKMFLQDLFTTEPQDGRFTNAFFLLLGWVARLTGLPIPWVYALARVATSTGLFYALYAFAASVGGSRLVRRAAVALGATASGLGWLAVLLGPHLSLPLPTVSCVDVGLAVAWGKWVREGLMMPEANTLASALLLPLFSFSMALLLWLVPMAWRALCRGDLRSAAVAGLLGLILGNVHTYDMIPVHCLLVALLVYLAIRRQHLGRALAAYAVFVAVSMPSLLYQVWVFRVDAVFREKALTVTASPTPLSYAVSFGLPLLLACGGAVLVVRRREHSWAPVLAWLGVGLAVAFLPGLSFQRKMIEGVHLPMVVMAAVAVTRWLPRVAGPLQPNHYKRRAAVALALAVIACVPSSAYFVVGRAMGSVAENNRSRTEAVLMPPYSLSRDDLAALEWLRANTAPDSAILCLPMLGSYVPGLTGRKTYIGHWAETLRFASEKLPAAWAAVIAGDSERGKAALGACSHMVIGEHEARAGAVRPPYPPVFASGRTAVYALSPAGKSDE